MADPAAVAPGIGGLVDALEAHVDARRVAGLSKFANLVASSPPLASACATSGGWFTKNCDNIVLSEFECGDQRGLVLGVLTGNYKDEGCGVASSGAALAILDSFSEPLLSEADLVPTLRRAAISGDEDIRRLSLARLTKHRFETVMGPRQDLRGIGTSMTVVAVLPYRVYGLHVGEGKAYLVREGTARKLTIEHTLDRDAEYRARVRSGEPAFELAALVVVRVLGMTPEVPALDGFRTDLSSGDWIVVGNLALTDHMMRDASFTGGPAAMTARLRDAMQDDFPQSPASVGCVVVA